MKQEHGKKGHVNVYILDHDQPTTGYGSHDRVLGCYPCTDGYVARIDRHHGLGRPTDNQVLKALRAQGYIKGKWQVTSRDVWDDGVTEDVYAERVQ